MERTNNDPTPTIPDAINHSISKNFTQIPNEVLKNPKISLKAKGLLALLLSNKKGWKSYITYLKETLKEGETAIRNAIKELEKFGYLLRIRYRAADSKQWQGSFWSYTDVPWHHDLTNTFKKLTDQNLELVIDGDPVVENIKMGSLKVDNQGVIIYNNNNTNSNNTYTSDSEGLFGEVSSNHDLIQPSHFPKFWKLYPSRGSKGKAKSNWNKLCNKDDRPTWKEIKQAVAAQKESEQWQTKKFIPHASTWINQERWLDDPENLKSFQDRDANGKPATGYRRKDGHKYETEESI